PASDPDDDGGDHDVGGAGHPLPRPRNRDAQPHGRRRPRRPHRLDGAEPPRRALLLPRLRPPQVAPPLAAGCDDGIPPENGTLAAALRPCAEPPTVATIGDGVVQPCPFGLQALYATGSTRGVAEEALDEAHRGVD